jgi:hypothetical protein
MKALSTPGQAQARRHTLDEDGRGRLRERVAGHNSGRATTLAWHLTQPACETA